MSLFARLAEATDRICAKPVAFISFNLLIVAAFLLAGIDVANIAISIVTADLVLLSAGANRRSFKALHAKLDELIGATDNARDDLERIEDEKEEKIEELRR